MLSLAASAIRLIYAIAIASRLFMPPHFDDGAAAMIRHAAAAAAIDTLALRDTPMPLRHMPLRLTPPCHTRQSGTIAAVVTFS